MSLIQISHVSETLGVNIELGVIIPNPGWNDKKSSDLADLKVLYLLHGLSDDWTAWQRYTTIETLAWHYGFAVILPTGGRSMYANMANGQAYFDYITEEIPEYLRKTFRFNLEPENVMIAGNSMGGLGAFKAAFLKPERYSKAFSLSGAIIPDIAHLPDHHVEDRKFIHELDTIYGGLEKIAGSDDDPRTWPGKLIANKAKWPELYSCIGTEDDLLPANRYFHEACKSLKIPLTYWEEEGGKHDWPFWQRNIAKWLSQIFPDKG